MCWTYIIADEHKIYPAIGAPRHRSNSADGARHRERHTPGPQGPDYNHQCYEKGRNVSRYVPSEQVGEIRDAIQGYQRFQALAQQYAQLVVEKTRAEREAGSKKKTRRQNSSWPKTRKSSS